MAIGDLRYRSRDGVATVYCGEVASLCHFYQSVAEILRKCDAIGMDRSILSVEETDL